MKAIALLQRTRLLVFATALCAVAPAQDFLLRGILPNREGGIQAHPGDCVAMVSNREQALAAGCYDTKPVELPRLLEKTEALLQTKSG